MNTIRIIAVILVVIASLALIAHLSSTDREYSRYNWDWTGTSGFFSSLEEHGARDVTAYDNLGGADDTLLMIVAPEGNFSSSEKTAIRSFLESGNSVFIADETGAANDLLASLGSKMSVVPGNLSSAEREYAESRSVIVHPTGEDPITANVTSIVLNRPAIVTGGETLLSTTIFSWVDLNGNGKIDGMEQLAAFGVLSREEIGAGTLYVFSDPSVFANGMLTARSGGQNSLFIGHLLNLRGNILVDQSHSATAGADWTLALANQIKSLMIFKISLLILSITIVVLAFYRKRGGVNGTSNN